MHLSAPVSFIHLFSEQVAYPVVTFEERAGLGDPFLHVAAHILRGIQARFLRQVADPDVPGDHRRAHEISVQSAQDTEERGFAGTVGADDADLGAVEEGERDIVENIDLVVLLGQVPQIEDVFTGQGITIEY